ncbi:hypothetical protein DRJ17_06730, partial [Candidatus Woesearchaeota archaeon]
ESGLLKTWGDDSNWRILRAKVDIDVGARVCVEWRVKRSATNCNPHFALTNSNNDQRVCWQDRDNDGDWDYQRIVNGSTSYVKDQATFAVDTWYCVQICRTGTTSFVSRILNSERSILASVADTQSAWTVAFTPVIWRNNNVNVYVDWFLIRKYSSSPPSISYSSEESGSWTIDGHTFTKRKKVTITSSQALSGYQIQLDYSQWGEPGIKITRKVQVVGELG